MVPRRGNIRGSADSQETISAFRGKEQVHDIKINFDALAFLCASFCEPNHASVLLLDSIA
jgi:hypothetical protein